LAPAEAQASVNASLIFTNSEDTLVLSQNDTI